MSGSRHIDRAQHHARLGLPVPTEARHRLIKRIMVKLTWFTTSHQIDHNLATVRALREISAHLADLSAQVTGLEAQMTLHRHHVSQVLAGIEASLRSEVLGADRRGDDLETDVVRLSATVAALRAQVDALAGTANTPQPEVAPAQVAAVRSLPGSARQ